GPRDARGAAATPHGFHGANHRGFVHPYRGRVTRRAGTQRLREHRRVRRGGFLTLPELLSAVRERGIELKAQGDRLSCKAPPGALTPEVSAALRAQEAELLALLAGGQDAHAKAAEPIPLQPQRERYPLSFTQRRSAIAAREGAGL